jgi:hypothetical protein
VEVIKRRGEGDEEAGREHGASAVGRSVDVNKVKML